MYGASYSLVEKPATRSRKPEAELDKGETSVINKNEGTNKNDKFDEE